MRITCWKCSEEPGEDGKTMEEGVLGWALTVVLQKEGGGETETGGTGEKS